MSRPGYVDAHARMDVACGLLWLLSALLEGGCGQGVYGNGNQPGANVRAKQPNSNVPVPASDPVSDDCGLVFGSLFVPRLSRVLYRR
ncbi:hypothetical protein Y1Q_0019968 [Alligator mississippiensis]|uniref:Secreted protein n=1 Tax=Alligator mississippiensis TaxID=8496 RepID=A0A151PE35_ALLMI|nr:hypothetical protein Y1Q_0019968 [Alligator mississippiensis]